MPGLGLRAAIIPAALVTALAAAVFVLRPSTRPADTAEPVIGSRPSPAAAGETSRARSAAEMLAQDSLPSLLGEGERVMRERKQYLLMLDAAHGAEPTDRAWSVAAEQALVGLAGSDALVATGITPDAWTRDCRSRTCKVAAAFGDYDDAQDWANYFLTGSGDILAQAELSIQRGADGATHVLIFGARR